jgi:hypothetical protein
MSSSVLEKLKVKPIPKKIQDLKCKSNDDSSIVINTKINDKTKKNLINRDDFIAKLNIPIKIKASTPVQIKITEPSSDVVPIC